MSITPWRDDQAELEGWREILDMAARHDALGFLRRRCPEPRAATALFATMQQERDRLMTELRAMPVTDAELDAIGEQLDALFVAANVEACRWSRPGATEPQIWPWPDDPPSPAPTPPSRMLGILQETTRQLLMELDLKHLLSLLVQRAVALTRSHSALLAMWNPEEETLEVVETYGFPALTRRFLPLSRQELVGGDVACLWQGPRQALLRGALGLAPSDELLWAPLRFQGEPLGVLACAAPHSDPEATELLALLAGHTTIALRNAALYRGALHKAVALRDANEQLRGVDRMKDEFLAVVSHELRTPINFITGFGSALLADDSLEAEQRHFVEQMLSGAFQLTALVDDLLDYSSMRAGRLSLHREHADVSELLTSAVEAHRVLADRQAIALTLSLPSEPLVWCVDRKRLGQVVSNLLTNALKFAPKGGAVALRARIERERLRLEVVDDGPGVPAAKATAVFERFSQLDTSATRTARGVGLGLAICKSLVEAHAGEIGVVSPPQATDALTPGRGSLFWLTLPA